jgi:hypothetical protein
MAERLAVETAAAGRTPLLSPGTIAFLREA